MVSWTGSDFLIFTEDSRLVIREPKQSPKGVSWKRSACWIPTSTFRRGPGPGWVPSGSAPASECQLHSEHLLGAGPRAGEHAGWIGCANWWQTQSGEMNQVGSKISHASAKENNIQMHIELRTASLCFLQVACAVPPHCLLLFPFFRDGKMNYFFPLQGPGPWRLKTEVNFQPKDSQW